ncbi:Lrp/AsnC family transcriptional regulator [Fulvivirgaceae bacterium BMA10]|uniref:Lrp/AsnC family transcriptional regulator n=1 Tax=Splendidivirga corallicola TaxID=3051826 RepID=A0ABT8KWE3_9BACT|nr:Lrp/AsnC family transcriptional regulator [Fulvivirgaceae bacterium BMA10]
MDKIDRKILNELSTNARISGAEIARKVHLSVPAVTERLRKLDKSGIIDRYTIRFNRESLGFNVLAFIKVWLDHTKVDQTKERLLAMSEVLECHHIAGEYDLLLKILVKNTTQLEDLLTKKIKNDPAITRTSTTIVLSTYKEEINVKPD